MDYFISLTHTTVSLLCFKFVKEKLYTLQLAHSFLTMRQNCNSKDLTLNNCGIVATYGLKRQLKLLLSANNLALPNQSLGLM